MKWSRARDLLVLSLVFILGLTAGYRLSQNGYSLPWGKNSTASKASPLQFLIKNQTGETPDNIDFKVFWEAWGLLQKNYLDQSKLVTNKMVDGAIGGMVASLGDAYTVYLPPADNQRNGEDLAGAFYGVGIELGYIDNVLAVMGTLKGTPAEVGGVEPKDLILHVKDESKKLDQDTSGWSLNQAVENIRGQKNTKIVLTLLRKSAEESKPFEVELTRGEIVVPSAELSFPEKNGKKVAQIKLYKFGERTNGEWEKIVSEVLARRSELSGVVLDMRGNPGGFFEGAIDVAGEFVKKGTVVVSQQGTSGKQDYTASGRARLVDLPLEILVNQGSASAAEIVAGALRDQRGAKLIGEKTFGKGTVQDRLELSNGGGIHITIAKWLLPKGSWIHETGLNVDIEVKDDPNTSQDEVLERAIEVI